MIWRPIEINLPLFLSCLFASPSLDKLATATKETCYESVKAGQMNRTVLVTSFYFIYIAKNLHFYRFVVSRTRPFSAMI